MKKQFLLLAAFFSLYSFADTHLADVIVKDRYQQDVSLKQYQGKPLYIKAWASWCPFCLATLDEIDEFSGENNATVNRAFTIVTLVSPNQLGEKNINDFVKWYNNLGYKNIVLLIDSQGEILKRTHIKGYPANIVLDKDLNIVKVAQGNWGKAKIKAETMR